MTLTSQAGGNNSKFLYSLLKKGLFSFSKLNCSDLKVSRIDINFIRNNKKTDNFKAIDFFNKSKEIFENKYGNGNAVIRRNYETNERSLLLGTRGSNFAARIYQKNLALKFELEIKKAKAKDLGLLLLGDSFLEFEHTVSEDYFSYFFRTLYLETCFTDWLVDLFRFKREKPKEHLVTADITKQFLTQTSVEKIGFYRLLQFLSFIRAYPTKKFYVFDQVYMGVEFKLADFIKAVQSTNNTYQRNVFLNFFDDLQGIPPFREKFAKQSFKKILLFPYVSAKQKTTRGPWVIQVAIAEQILLHSESYTFHFPPSFFYYSNERNLRVKSSIVLAFAQESSITKKYPIQSFLNEFSNRSYSTQAKVKREVLQEFRNLLKFKIIEPKFLFEIENNQEIRDKIQLKDINSSKYIYFYETINNTIKK